MAYNIRESSIEDLITAFKHFLIETDAYIVSETSINIKALALLTRYVSQFESKFLTEKSDDMEYFISNKMEFQN